MQACQAAWGRRGKQQTALQLQHGNMTMAMSFAEFSVVCRIVLLLWVVQNAACFSVDRQVSPHRSSNPLSALSNDNIEVDSTRRRDTVIGSLTAAAALWTSPLTAQAEKQSSACLDCLLDLPPARDDHVRIYLARHGQTENNRLRLVQGARIDPPINENGIQMANRMGMALARLQDQCPNEFLHSNLLRAKQTAAQAALETRRQVSLKTLDALAEVDFGPISEGKPVSEVRTDMMRTYAAWSAGFVDTRPAGGGESGREVLTRASTALRSLVDEAAAIGGGSVVAVAHSTYLRMLLATMLDIPLAQAATLEQKNGCINVLDLRRDGATRVVGPKSTVLGGRLSSAPRNFGLEIPKGTVVRVNEKRHLEGIPLA